MRGGATLCRRATRRATLLKQATRTPEFWALRKAGVVHGGSEVVDPLTQTVGAARSKKGFLVNSFDESWHSAMWS